MSVEIKAYIDPKDLAEFGKLKGHIRVAAAIGLTKTAKDAQGLLKDESASIFHLRNRWVPQGIRIEPATAASLVAKVGSIDKYMARHVDGQKKDPAHALSISSTRDSQGRYATGGLLIGAYADIADAKTHTQERRMLNRIDGQKKKTFQIIGRDGTILIVRRRGKGRIKGLEILAALKPEAKEQAIWHMDATVAGVVGARFGSHFEAAMTK